MNGRNFGIERVLEGIDAATKANLSPLKINAVVQKNVNDHTLVDLAKYFKGTGHIVRFIEYMDVGNKNGWELDEVVPANDILSLIDQEMPLEPIDPNYRGEVARRYRYKDGQGEIGIIASVSQPFCGDCSRARLSTDGSLYTCLFASRGLNLRDTMRSGGTDTELESMIKDIWQSRTVKYSEERSASIITDPSEPKIEMYQIGG
jgi:cyclic pyranopterin phosphate synthase